VDESVSIVCEKTSNLAERKGQAEKESTEGKVSLRLATIGEKICKEGGAKRSGIIRTRIEYGERGAQKRRSTSKK